MKILVCFQPIFNFELKGKRSRAEPSRAELKILQLELCTDSSQHDLNSSLSTIVIVGELDMQPFMTNLQS